MDTPNAAQIRTMSKEDLSALNNRMAKKLAGHMVGMLFLKLSVAGVLTVVAKKAAIEAAKRA
jgi:ribosomal protein L29